MKVTPSFASLNGADEAHLAVTVKHDGPVLTYSSLETEPEHKAALNFKKKCFKHRRRHSNCRSSWMCCNCAGPAHPEVLSLCLWDMLNYLAK